MKISSTRISPWFIGPSLRSWSLISSLPPGMLSISGRKTTLVSSTHVMAIITTAIGTPTSIHCANPMSISWLVLMCPARRVFGGVPMIVLTDPTEAA